MGMHYKVYLCLKVVQGQYKPRMAFRLVMGIAKQEGIISAENSNSCKKHKIKNHMTEKTKVSK